MTRQTMKNRINKVLHSSTKGIHRDDSWIPVHDAFRALESSGYPVIIVGTSYRTDENGNPCQKRWNFTVPHPDGGKPFSGIVVASGCGTVADPLSQYDVVAYVS
jgi:hypothetical protein